LPAGLRLSRDGARKGIRHRRRSRRGIECHRGFPPGCDRSPELRNPTRRQCIAQLLCAEAN